MIWTQGVLQSMRRCRPSQVGMKAHAEDDPWPLTSACDFLGVRSATNGRATSGIQRNVPGEKVLGLPGGPAQDRELPWR